MILVDLGFTKSILLWMFESCYIRRHISRPLNYAYERKLFLLQYFVRSFKTKLFQSPTSVVEVFV